MKIKTLSEFYGLMNRTRDTRRKIVRQYLEKPVPPPSTGLSDLEQALEALRSIPGKGSERELAYASGRSIRLNLNYEMTEMEKDLVFFRQGEGPFAERLEQENPGFREMVDRGTDLFRDLEGANFISDRDGTVNNYCGTYLSSIQSAYNAVFLSRFASGKRCKNPVILTSAPLQSTGLADISVNPPGLFVYAGSKGREFLDRKGKKRVYPVEREKQALLDRLNQELSRLVSTPEHRVFSMIGSGLQFKFGQTTLARQDIFGSIPEDTSLGLIDTVRGILRELDPGDRHFRIEDTGKDIEIILTISSDGGESLKDFDKGDGVDFLDRELKLGLAAGPNLICGDTSSDVPMITAARAKNPESRAVFVTRDGKLIDKVRTVCPEALIVPEPDVLVCILGKLAEEER